MTQNRNSTYLRTRVEEAATYLPTLEFSFRAMFGGLMIYVAGKPFASLSEPGLSLKLNENDRTALLQEPGAKFLQHDGEAPSKQYVVIPAHILENNEQLSLWLERSATYAMTIPSKKRKSS